MRTERLRALVRICVCSVWMLCAHTPAQASPLFELTGSVGDAGGQQGRISASGASAAYFNPALLGDAPTGATFGVVVLHQAIDIRLDARGAPGADVPNDLQNAAHRDGTRWDGYPLGTDILQNGRAESPMYSPTTARPRQAAGSGFATSTYEAFGIVTHFFERRLALGFYGLVPNKSFLRLTSFYVDEREQYLSNSLHPELYGDRTSALSMALGAGFRITDAFSVGLGTSFIFRASATTPVFVADASRLEDLVLNVNASANLGFSPHGGFSLRPHPRVHLTGTLHAPEKQEVSAHVRFLLASGLEQTSTVSFVFDWTPWQAGLATSVDLMHRSEQTLSLVASGVYGRWSQYVDRHGERPAPGLGFQDTITASGGARAQLRDLSMGLDVQYKPTPVPPQFGRSNYVDNDRIGGNLTTSYAFHLQDTTLRLGLALQGFWLLQRSVQKLSTPTFPDGLNRTPSLVKDEVPDDGQVGGVPIPNAAGLQTNNPGWPGFRSSGFLATAGLFVAVSL